MTEFNTPNTDTTKQTAEENISSKPSIAKSVRSEEAVLITLIVLSAIGIGFTNFRPLESFWFWVAMVPVFCATSLYIGWSKARKRGEGISRIIWVQLLHWIGLLAAIALIYLLYETTNRINSNQLALLALLSLALATFLAGVHFEWRFMVVGVILGAAVAGTAFVEQLIWMIIIPIAALIVLIIFWWKRSI
ncbi:MAG: hypothetical protein O7D98_08855 [Candidatus Dadabacteria bacterium]|nr:hypothetical protein [Candidatus Dadabacteria bacterium]